MVSYNNSDAFGDLWHKRVQDYVNIRDLCVMWGENINDPGRVIEEYVSFVDLAPTFFDVAGFA